MKADRPAPSGAPSRAGHTGKATPHREAPPDPVTACRTSR